jgi:phosphatidylinositol alpha-1,6-mannosyltransferase
VTTSERIGAVQAPRTLVVTNDYPPRVGGIQRTLEALVTRFPPDRVAVLCPAWDGADAFDRDTEYRIFRQPERFLWPKRSVARRVRAAVEEFGAEVVLFGATYPLSLLGPGLAKRGTPYVSAAHGFEYWLSIAPGAHGLVRRATSRASRVVVMCSAFIARVVRTAVPERVPVSVMYPGADVDAFRPDVEFDGIRRAHGVDDRRLVVCVSRLVPRKGQDVLIRAMTQVRSRVPDATLLLVGGGPYRERLEEMALEGPGGAVLFAGEVSESDLPRYYRAGDVFAMPCRNRLGGLEVEGWGNVFIEAAACGRPVVAGDSGGARETLIDGVTGLMVDGKDVAAVADAVAGLLDDPSRGRAMGAAGRARVERHFTWERAAGQLAGWLREAAEPAAQGPHA